MPVFDAYVLLETDGWLPPLPVTAATIPSDPLRYQAMTPFADDGYGVSAADLVLAEREAKLFRSPKTAQYLAPIRSTRSVLRVSMEREDLQQLGLVHQATPAPRAVFQMEPEAQEVLQSLRLHVFFPSGLRLESCSELQNESVVYGRGFYPFDTGPLAADPIRIGHGLQLAVPETLASLSQIEARFVCAIAY